MYSLRQVDLMSAYEKACKSATTASQLEQIMKKAVADAGATVFSYHHLPSNEDTSRFYYKVVSHYGYSKEWLSYYKSGAETQKDPVHFLPFKLNRPYWWHEAVSFIDDEPDRENVNSTMNSQGLKCGLAFPVFEPGKISGLFLLGFPVEQERIPESTISILQWASQLSHQRFLELSNPPIPRAA